MSYTREALAALKPLTAFSPETEARIRHSTEIARKGALRLHIIAPDGSEVERCSIRYTLQRHEFKFGANGFMFRQFRGDQAWKNAVYEEKFKELFNLAVVPFYWNTYEPERGRFRCSPDCEVIDRRPPVDELLSFCEENAITPKGHPLIWHTLLPEWLPQDRSRLLDEYERRIAMIAERYGARIPIFDVCNEGLQLDSLDPVCFPKGNVPASHIERAFELAGKYFPASTELVYNEGPWQSWNNYHNFYTPLYLLARRLQNAGLPLRGLGLQYHLAFFRDLNQLVDWSRQMLDPAHLYAHMDLYGSLGIPLNISEITLPAMPALGDGEAFQSLVAERLYRIWFSHPAVHAIIWWNLVDKTAYRADSINNNEGENRFLGGLLNNDMTGKLSWKVLHRLIRTEWHTDETLEFESEGKNKIYGFYGDYLLRIRTDSGCFELPVSISRNAPAVRTLKLDASPR